MKTFVKILGTIIGLILLVVIGIALLTSWMDRWGVTDNEISVTFPGDELVPEPASFANRSVSVNAAPEYICSWIIKLDVRKGGWYSYTWIESMICCKTVNADCVHPE